MAQRYDRGDLIAQAVWYLDAAHQKLEEAGVALVQEPIHRDCQPDADNELAPAMAKLVVLIGPLRRLADKYRKLEIDRFRVLERD